MSGSKCVDEQLLPYPPGMAKWGRSLADGFWSVDGALGGQRRPTRMQRWASRHPIGVGLCVAVLFALFFFGVSQGEEFVDALLAVLFGVVMGLLFFLTAVVERRRQRRLVRLGVWDGS